MDGSSLGEPHCQRRCPATCCCCFGFGTGGGQAAEFLAWLVGRFVCMALAMRPRNMPPCPSSNHKLRRWSACRGEYWPDVWEGRAHKYVQPAASPPAAAGVDVVPTPAVEPAPKVQADRGAGEGDDDEQPPQAGRRKRTREEREVEGGEEPTEQAPGFKARLVQRLYGLVRLVRSSVGGRREAQP
jgi:hypothetical protein